MFAGLIAYAMMMSGPVTVPDGNLKISWNQVLDGAGAGSGVMEGEYGPVAFQDDNEVMPGCTVPGLWHWAAQNNPGYFYLYVGSVTIGNPPPPPQLYGNGGFRLTSQSSTPFLLEYTRNEADGSQTVVKITK